MSRYQYPQPIDWAKNSVDIADKYGGHVPVADARVLLAAIDHLERMVDQYAGVIAGLIRAVTGAGLDPDEIRAHLPEVNR